MPNPPVESKLYEVVAGKLIRVGEPAGLTTFHAGARLWLKPEEAALHGDSLVLIYPPENSPSEDD